VFVATVVPVDVHSTATSDGAVAAADPVGDASADAVTTGDDVVVGELGAGATDGGPLGDGVAPQATSSMAAVAAIDASPPADRIRVIDA